ncbi:bifunctional adenosylcobinamide kinase/adenosylcobinamide-phosphate guanylyltransferase [Acetivibrio ethanolgignens]|uniref:Adenosylcobinamide kinase n=1 Tax=Acetivibrio ethanolgignens TaxID=290052 RepID=A0A0V8QFF8_9FIRM|nr:bifunctional adenosylcobinamide kinase/adenosylcobinamide-phosphate guanylyltransferase [Acetivibrio ethanolgignens]KSV59357.1 cobinamide kinase [Acetivibrio ethanolgignens]
MITLIMGKSGSGKSAYAEEYTAQLSQKNRKYYLATMEVFDEEGRIRAERHRKQRRGKGFVTIEQPVDIYRVMDKIENVRMETALLECISNLTANEMFHGETMLPGPLAADKVVNEVEKLGLSLRHLVIVSNSAFEAGTEYDEATMEYIQTVADINERLADLADQVIEVVEGIPNVIKER